MPAIEELRPSEHEFVKGGDGQDAVQVGPSPSRLWVDLLAYHDGVGPGGRYALLILSKDGVQLGQIEDRNFDNYHLELRRTVLLDAGAVATFRIQIANEVAAMTRHGLIASIRAV